jgi:hypothetical protein
MSGISRRRFAALSIAALAGAAFAVPAGAHTPYRQWVIYRKKHLLLGSHRDDPAGYRLAREAAEELAFHVPSSRARVARAPAATRLAGLIATDQLDIAVLEPDLVRAMSTGEGIFGAYGAIDLQTLIVFVDGRALVAHARFPDEHAAIVAEALVESPLAPLEAQFGSPPVPWHPAAQEIVRLAGTGWRGLPGAADPPPSAAASGPRPPLEAADPPKIR